MRNKRKKSCEKNTRTSRIAMVCDVRVLSVHIQNCVASHIQVDGNIHFRTFTHILIAKCSPRTTIHIRVCVCSARISACSCVCVCACTADIRYSLLF